jgi:hypothetical protein
VRDKDSPARLGNQRSESGIGWGRLSAGGGGRRRSRVAPSEGVDRYTRGAQLWPLWVGCAREREPRGRGGGQRSGFSITRSRSLAAFQTAD